MSQEKQLVWVVSGSLVAQRGVNIERYTLVKMNATSITVEKRAGQVVVRKAEGRRFIYDEKEVLAILRVHMRRQRDMAISKAAELEKELTMPDDDLMHLVVERVPDNSWKPPQSGKLILDD
jgi:hypothetical protein